jgi:Zn-dependent peptidase ImmA (M78 family)
VVNEILEKTQIKKPPIDVFDVARALGIAIVWDDRQNGRARYVRLNHRYTGRRQATILLRPDPRTERRQWAVAHEIGEHVAYHVFAQWGIDPRECASNAREVVANNLANRLLLPSLWFAEDGRACDWDLPSLKARYLTASHELIARRMLECGPSAIVSVFDQQRLSFRQGNLPGQTPPPLSAEMKCWRDVHQNNKPQQLREGSTRIRGWPIHEPGWQREILCTEIDEWATEPRE